MVPRERQQLLCHRSCRRGAHLTGNSEVIHNREPSWETSLDSLRNQAITLKPPSPGVNECNGDFSPVEQRSGYDLASPLRNMPATRKWRFVDFATLKWPHFDHYIWPHPNR